MPQSLNLLSPSALNTLLPENWFDQPLERLARFAPVQRLNWQLARDANVEVWVKREDLLDPFLGGNKLYKLHAHLRRWVTLDDMPLLTFGGAYSNHLCATAAAGAALRRKTIGIVRGERASQLSITLKRAEAQGMELHFVSREDYATKHTQAFEQRLRERLGDFYCVPEGGGDLLGARGCFTWARATLAMCQRPPSHVFTASGTGATLAGIAAAMPKTCSLHGVLALKGRDEALHAFNANVLTMTEKLLQEGEPINAQNPSVTLETNYHCGGYAKFPEYLRAFVAKFEAETGVPLERVYTAKVFWALAQQLISQAMRPGSTVLVFHTGGLQILGER